MELLEEPVSSVDESLNFLRGWLPLLLVVAEIPNVSQPLNVSPDGHVNDVRAFQRIIQVRQIALLPSQLEFVGVAYLAQMTLEDYARHSPSGAQVPSSCQVSCRVDFMIEQVGL